MGRAILEEHFKLTNSDLKILENYSDGLKDYELSLVSTTKAVACPFCKGNGCYGVCSMVCTE